MPTHWDKILFMVRMLVERTDQHKPYKPPSQLLVNLPHLKGFTGRQLLFSPPGLCLLVTKGSFPGKEMDQKASRPPEGSAVKSNSQVGHIKN